MKVLHVIDQLTVGGAEVLTVNVVNLLAAQPDIEVHLCVARKESSLKESIDKRVKYIFLKKRKTVDKKFYKALHDYINENEIDIIHAHNTSYFSSTIVKFLLKRKVKLIWHNHTGAYVNLKGIKFIILKLFSRLFDAILNVNVGLNEWSAKKLKAKKNIVLNNFAAFTNKKEITKLTGLPGKRIVCLAGLRPVKDHPNLINAFEIFLEKHPDWTLHLIGKNYGDDYADHVIEMILDKNLEKKIFFYGVRSDIKHILNQATVGTLTSKKEGFPISVLEYGLAKLPVILTNVGNNKAVVKDQRAIVPPNDPEELANCMTMMAENEDISKEVANSLHKQVVDYFSEEHFISKLKSTYFSL
ncbi:glycosyltransferase [Pseudotenacibaculum haliotis]|uniref:Glycosyltransferase n=1 Tax=Pseudotenacibaculum haliotis TaxID=1862138 RepID=A0ABW5LT46_9FLAO